MTQKATVSHEFHMCILKSEDEILAEMSDCDRPVYDALLHYDQSGGVLNGQQYKIYQDYREQLSDDWLAGVETWRKCIAGNVPEPDTTTPEPTLRVSLVAKGGGSSSSSSSGNLSATVSMDFAPETPEVCGALPYMLTHDVLTIWANNTCEEVKMSVSASGGGSGSTTAAATTGEGIAAAALGFTVSLQSNRLVNYSVQFKDSPMPETAPFLSRVEAYNADEVGAGFGALIRPAALEGWEVYIELKHNDTGNIFWCGWRIPFADVVWDESGLDQGSGTQEIDALQLFTTHPGVAYDKLKRWVEAVGPDGTWVGRVVIFNSYVPAAIGAVTYSGVEVAQDSYFPPAPFYLAGLVYAPGAKGIPLNPRT